MPGIALQKKKRLFVNSVAEVGLIYEFIFRNWYKLLIINRKIFLIRHPLSTFVIYLFKICSDILETASTERDSTR
jgi:hypothetical protein